MPCWKKNSIDQHSWWPARPAYVGCWHWYAGDQLGMCPQLISYCRIWGGVKLAVKVQYRTQSQWGWFSTPRLVNTSSQMQDFGVIWGHQKQTVNTSRNIQKYKCNALFVAPISLTSWSKQFYNVFLLMYTKQLLLSDFEHMFVKIQ